MPTTLSTSSRPVRHRRATARFLPTQTPPEILRNRGRQRQLSQENRARESQEQTAARQERDRLRARRRRQGIQGINHNRIIVHEDGQYTQQEINHNSQIAEMDSDDERNAEDIIRSQEEQNYENANQDNINLLMEQAHITPEDELDARNQELQQQLILRR